jgi:replicative DNA helicase
MKAPLGRRTQTRQIQKPALPLFVQARQRAAGPPALTQRQASRIPTGLASLDKELTGGLSVGAATLIGARPSMGASSLLVGATLAAIKRGHPTAYLSEHGSERRLRGRLVLLEARVNGYRFAAGLVTPEDRLALAAARERIPWRLLSWAVKPRLSPFEVADHLFAYRPKLVVADLRPTPPDPHAPPEGFATLASGVEYLARLAIEHQAAILVRWILPRGPLGPTRAELPGQGALAEAFDTVLLLHRRDASVGYAEPADGSFEFGSAAPAGSADLQIVRRDFTDLAPVHLHLRFDQRYAALSDPSASELTPKPA